MSRDERVKGLGSGEMVVVGREEIVVIMRIIARFCAAEVFLQIASANIPLWFTLLSYHVRRT
jgi:hypothetical protein